MTYNFRSQSVNKTFQENFKGTRVKPSQNVHATYSQDRRNVHCHSKNVKNVKYEKNQRFTREETYGFVPRSQGK
jgi:hypothetical protein